MMEQHPNILGKDPLLGPLNKMGTRCGAPLDDPQSTFLGYWQELR